MPKAPPFTAETARAAALLAHASRRAAKDRLKALESAAVSAVITGPLPSPIAPPPKPDDFDVRRLARIRKQLNRIDGEIEACIESEDEDSGKRLKDLIQSQTWLSEQERILAGRPLPGSHRPQAPRRGATGAGPVVPE